MSIRHLHVCVGHRIVLIDTVVLNGKRREQQHPSMNTSNGFPKHCLHTRHKIKQKLMYNNYHQVSMNARSIYNTSDNNMEDIRYV